MTKEHRSLIETFLPVDDISEEAKKLGLEVKIVHYRHVSLKFEKDLKIFDGETEIKNEYQAIFFRAFSPYLELIKLISKHFRKKSYIINEKALLKAFRESLGKNHYVEFVYGHGKPGSG